MLTAYKCSKNNNFTKLYNIDVYLADLVILTDMEGKKLVMRIAVIIL